VLVFGHSKDGGQIFGSIKTGEETAVKRLPAGGSLVCYRVAYRRSRAVYSSIPAITELLNTFTRASAVSGTPLTVAG